MTCTNLATGRPCISNTSTFAHSVPPMRSVRPSSDTLSDVTAGMPARCTDLLELEDFFAFSLLLEEVTELDDSFAFLLLLDDVAEFEDSFTFSLLLDAAEELVDTELLETELLDTELLETELLDTELLDTELLDTELLEDCGATMVIFA